MTPFAAIVLCAGQGTRMKSARAKVLHTLAGRPLGYYALRCALDAGATRVVAVVGHQADEVRETLAAAFPDERRLTFALQREQKGTAHAVRCARRALAGVKSTLLILYGDVPLLRVDTVARLLALRAQADRPLALVTARATDPAGYGRIIRSDQGVERVAEERDCTEAERTVDEINAGIYAVSASFLWPTLSRVRAENAPHEFYLTDLAEAAARLGKHAPTVAAPFDEISGVNDRAELARVGRALRRRINARHLASGVALGDPDATYIDDSVFIGADTTLGPSVSLGGNTRIGRGVTIGAGCIISDSDVADGVQIRPYCVLEGTCVDEGALVGPFARLRPGTELGREVHVGNFVETKKARIGARTKANHLSYLGDCEIGRGVNVGAGTITCNYDGVAKHVTTLGDGAFVGSDTQFVAPVTVGAGAYIGSGSTIVKDVPAGALAVARGRQMVRPGWASARARQLAGAVQPPRGKLRSRVSRGRRRK